MKTDYPPLGFLDKDGVNKGFDIDIAKALSKELLGREKEEVQFIPVTSGNRIAFLTSRKIDIIVATLTITEERKQEVDFSIPYFITGQQILVQGNSRVVRYQDLSGKKVATIRGSTGDTAIKELVSTAERIEFERNLEALQALKDRSVEAFVEDSILLYNPLQKNLVWKWRVCNLFALPGTAWELDAVKPPLVEEYTYLFLNSELILELMITHKKIILILPTLFGNGVSIFFLGIFTQSPKWTLLRVTVEGEQTYFLAFKCKLV